MVIHKIKSDERKGQQHWNIVYDCESHWRWLNNKSFQSYPDIMNMVIYRRNYKHSCWIALTYHFNPNKW